ncbi:hypothetical protein ACIPC1_17645 [Streptomyces sp. NPDC087263]|uniref:hypothetical protein n=1 Tax=Streptomyces sp. NPDC087263 TaxID=3365773 RepID=UPI00382CA431
MKRGLPVRALLIPAFILMAITSLLTFAPDWQAVPAGTAWQFLWDAAFSLTGGDLCLRDHGHRPQPPPQKPREPGVTR